MSRRPGIGFGYINNDNVRYHRQSKGQKFEVTNEGGIVQRMPRYYKQFIFTKNELESNKKLLETKMDSRFDEDWKNYTIMVMTLDKCWLKEQLIKKGK
jgi:hypothetical protein